VHRKPLPQPCVEHHLSPFEIDYKHVLSDYINPQPIRLRTISEKICKCNRICVISALLHIWKKNEYRCGKSTLILSLPPRLGRAGSLSLLFFSTLRHPPMLTPLPRTRTGRRALYSGPLPPRQTTPPPLNRKKEPELIPRPPRHGGSRVDLAPEPDPTAA
jgi:hypothetical protein